MSDRTTNNYPVQNNWPSDSANVRMTSQQANFRNSQAIHPFTNSSTHRPQSNYPNSNVVTPPPEMRPSFNAIRQSSSFERQHPPPNVNHSFNSQSNQVSNNFPPERDFSKQAPPNYPFPKQNSLLPPPMRFTGPKNNFNSTGCVPQLNPPNFPNNTQSRMPPPNFQNNTQSNLPPLNFSKNAQSRMPPLNFQNNTQSNLPPPNFPENSQARMPPPNFSNNPQSGLPPPSFPNNRQMENCVPFKHPPANQNNFQQFNPTPGPSHQQRNMPFNQNCDPFTDHPPPNRGPMPPRNSNDGAVKFESSHQRGQLHFEPPHSQLRPRFPEDKRFQNNPQCISNLNVMLPPPTFCEPPPNTFLTPPPFGPSIMQEGKSLTAPNAVPEEEKRLDSFLQRFQSVKKGKPQNVISVAKFRSHLQKSLLLSKLLQTRRQHLATLLQSSEAEWKAEMANIAQLKHQLSQACEVLSVSSNLSAVKRKLKLIKKKREIKMKLKQEASSMKLKKEQERESLSQEIDKWLDTIKEKNLKQKREIEMQKEADNILSEVKRKIQEAKKALEKLKVFEKLRLVRQLNAEQKGLFSDQNDNFERKIAGLRSLLNSQLADYGAEERALKVMLETEQCWQMEREAEWKVKRARMLQHRRQKGIVESLFGNTEEPSPEDPLFLFFQHHNSANMSIENLVQIRHHWDIHLSDAGESIPQQWVVPVSASNPSWEEACKD